MVSWKEFRKSLPANVASNKMAVKLLFIHWTLKLNGLVCCGAGDVAEQMFITDAEVAQALAHLPTKTIMYRDPANQNEVLNLKGYQKDGGSKILVVLESDTNEESVCSLFDLHCHGKSDRRTDKLLSALQTYIAETHEAFRANLQQGPSAAEVKSGASDKSSAFERVPGLRASISARRLMGDECGSQSDDDYYLDDLSDEYYLDEGEYYADDLGDDDDDDAECESSEANQNNSTIADVMEKCISRK